MVILLHLQTFAGEVITIDNDNPLRPTLSVVLTKMQLLNIKAQGLGHGKELLGLYMIVDKEAAKVAVAGRYSLKDTRLYYTPMYDLGYDMHFVAKAKTGNEQEVVKNYHTPENPRSVNKAAVVSAYPIADTIPYNTLYFHVRFSQPMLEDKHAYKYIKMYDEQGVERPRAWRQKSFWLDDGKLLVLMIHPGRVKNGIHYESPLFDSGKYYRLEVLQNIKDANGNRLKEAYEQRYYVTGQDREIPKMNKYFIKQPSSNTKEPIKIYFSEGMDNASVVDGVKVLDGDGNVVECKVREGSTDDYFTVTPINTWGKGSYTLELKGSVSDYSGNRINRLFEIKNAREIEKDALVNKWEFEVR
ncbi:MAG: Ig-like domain-containing protein [Flavipsychrobacter sp.]